MQLLIFSKECKKRTAEVAACQTHALRQMGPEHHRDLSSVMTHCEAKFGPPR
jgi:hypothetical protein